MKHRILIENNQQNKAPFRGYKTLVRRAIAAVLEEEGFDEKAEVSVTLVSPEEIQELNKTWRGVDRPTDVLSFPMFDFAAGEVPVYPKNESLPLGDVVLSLERARVQAAEIGHSTMREVVFLCIHSTLHLLGYDHELSPDDDEDMQRRQREIMKILGLE